jgi:outer membrane protein assembly factor BamB
MNNKFVIIFCITTILVTGITTHAAEITDSWPGIRGNASGTASIVYDGKNEMREWHFKYKAGRRYRTGACVWASPALAIVKGKPMAFIGGYNQAMHALDLSTKRVVWKKISNGEISSTPAIGKIDGNDIVFWSSSDRTLYANRASDGSQIWTRELIPASPSLGDVTVASPVIHKGKLYVTVFAYDRSLSKSDQSGLLFCIDPKYGNVLWVKKIITGFLNSPVAFVHNWKSFLLATSRRGLVVCLDLSEVGPGSPARSVWTFQMPHEVLGSPAVLEGKRPIVFLGSKYGNLIAIDAITGKEVWQRMAGNWIDNTVCVGKIDEEDAIFTGSYDYQVYAFKARNGELIWKKAVGGEIYSAPAFFHVNDHPYLVVSALDNHLYVLDARKGELHSSYFTGNPIWDRIAKGETLWGSPAVVSSGDNTVIVHGSYDDTVYAIPFMKEVSVRATARSVAGLWMSIGIVFMVFSFVVLPLVIYLPRRKG